jgi:hypothetical protein
MAERDFRWRPDAVHRPEYPPPRDFGPGHDPGDADDLGNETTYWPPASDLTDEARLELRRCATAFENTAKRLREIVGNE